MVAFTSNRTDDPDANYNTDIWVVKADNEDKGEELLQITTNPGPDASPAWSPDGKSIAHTSTTDTDAMLYATNHLAVITEGGAGQCPDCRARPDGQQPAVLGRWEVDPLRPRKQR